MPGLWVWMEEGRKRKMEKLPVFSPYCGLGRPYLGKLPFIVLINPHPSWMMVLLFSLYRRASDRLSDFPKVTELVN